MVSGLVIFILFLPFACPIFSKNINEFIKLEHDMRRVDEMSVLAVNRRVAPENRVTFVVILPLICIINALARLLVNSLTRAYCQTRELSTPT